MACENSDLYAPLKLKSGRLKENVLQFKIQNITSPSVLQCKVFILEFFPIDALATSAVMVGKVASLAHETWNDSMERTALESKAFFSSTQCSEVL